MPTANSLPLIEHWAARFHFLHEQSDFGPFHLQQFITYPDDDDEGEVLSKKRLLLKSKAKHKT